MSNTKLKNTWSKLSPIATCAKNNKTFEFTSLAHLLNIEFLKDCYLTLDRNKAAGVDKVSWQEYKEDMDNNLKSLVQKLKRKSFKPLPAKRVYIPKANGEQRPLGISTIENKIVENCSYGFRPKRDAHQ